MRNDEKREGRCFFFSVWHFQLELNQFFFFGHLETFAASSKDLLPKRFMYRKLMPDIFCHQEPQTQIKCQKSAKVVTFLIDL